MLLQLLRLRLKRLMSWRSSAQSQAAPAGLTTGPGTMPATRTPPPGVHDMFGQHWCMSKCASLWSFMSESRVGAAWQVFGDVAQLEQSITNLIPQGAANIWLSTGRAESAPICPSAAYPCSGPRHGASRLLEGLTPHSPPSRLHLGHCCSAVLAAGSSSECSQHMRPSSPSPRLGGAGLAAGLIVSERGAGLEEAMV